MQRLNKQQQELALKKQKYQLYASSPSQEEEKKNETQRTDEIFSIKHQKTRK